jgi:UDP-GlcNAc:undecaprenyl-phosphate/decaprenyl-phosphate GlcNAc-1-phosphate transferase
LRTAARALALRLGLLDHALTSRKVHGRPIPRLGGVAIVAAFYAPLVGLLVTDSSVGQIFYADRGHAVGLFVGGLVMAALGVWDDLRGTGARTKFAIQFGVAALMCALGFRIEQIATPFGPAVPLGWFSVPFTVLWIAGVVNAMNLIDGLDGLAGGVALIAVATTFVIALQHGEPLMILITATLGGAVLGFLFYNFNPASIFMGDTGSMFLGFVLATSAIRTHQKATTAVAMLVPIVALGLPIGDTLLSMTRRAVRGAPLFHSDRGHIHHRLMALGFSQRQTVLLLYGVCALLGATAVALTRASGLQTAAALAGLVVVALLLLTWVGYIKLGNTPRLLEERKRNLELRAAIREAGERIRAAAGPSEVWEWLKTAAPALGASCIALEVVQRERGERSAAQRSLGFDEAGPDLFRARYSLLGERPDDGSIELGWTDGRTAIDRDTEIAIELLCEHVLAALQRIEGARDAEAAKVVSLR